MFRAKYFVTNPKGHVAVATLGSVELAQQVAESAPPGLCIAGKVETENIGIEKVIKNVLSNPAIRFLICSGKEASHAYDWCHHGGVIRERYECVQSHRGFAGMRPVLTEYVFGRSRGI